MVNTALTVSIIKAIAALFSLLASCAGLFFLLYHRAYKRLLHKLFLSLLFSSILTSLAFLFESISVDIIVLVNENSTREGGSVDDGLTAVMCTVSGAFIHYSSWLDILMITVTVIWLVKITLRSGQFRSALKKSLHKKKTKQRYWECFTFSVLFVIPILPIIPPLLAKEYKADQGPWCRIQIIHNHTMNNDEAKLDTNALITGLMVWYIPVFLLLLLDTILLIYSTIRLFYRLKKSHAMLKQRFADVLQDEISLGIFLLVIYIVYCIDIITALHYIITTQREYPLWIIQAASISIRGIAVLFMFFNPRMWKKIRGMKIKVDTTSEEKLGSGNDESFSKTPNVTDSISSSYIKLKETSNKTFSMKSKEYMLFDTLNDSEH